MATWIAHLRIAEKILEKYDIDELSFIAGNIGPDSGVPDVTRSKFDPPKKITHWVDDTIKGGESENINHEGFYSQHVKSTEVSKFTDKRYAFILGYYIHLLTDIEWSRMHRKKIQTDQTYSNSLKENPQFIWEVKKDWYGLDFKYVRDEHDNIFMRSFIHIDKIPDYLDYFPKEAFTRQVKYIQEFYQGDNDWVNKEFKYLTKEEMDCFVEDTTHVIIDILDKRIQRNT